MKDRSCYFCQFPVRPTGDRASFGGSNRVRAAATAGMPAATPSHSRRACPACRRRRSARPDQARCLGGRRRRNGRALGARVPARLGIHASTSPSPAGAARLVNVPAAGRPRPVNARASSGPDDCPANGTSRTRPVRSLARPKDVAALRPDSRDILCLRASDRTWLRASETRYCKDDATKERPVEGHQFCQSFYQNHGGGPRKNRPCSGAAAYALIGPPAS